MRKSSPAANVLTRVFTGFVSICFLFTTAGLAQSSLPAGEPQTLAVSGPVSTVMSALRLVKFSGELKDPTGQPLTGVAGVTFAIYKDEQGGTPLWQETQNVQLDGQGNYAALLGSTTSEGLPVELFNSGESRWLGVQALAAGAQEQTRVLLVSVPYALKAADADTVGGMPLSAFVLTAPRGGVGSRASSRTAAQAAAAAGAANVLPKWNNDGTLTDSAIFESGGKVGINTKTPAVALDVAGPAGAPGNVNVSGTLNLQDTANASTGVLTFNSVPFLHNFGSIDSGDPNTFVGAKAGNFTMTSVGLTAVGASALANVTSGSANTAIGNKALTNNKKGSSNTAIGSRALLNNTDGSSNTAVGRAALAANQSSDENTAVGYRALSQNTDTRNTAVGSQALSGLVSDPDNPGHYNIAIGWIAGVDLTRGSNNIYMGNRGVAKEADTIRIGWSIGGPLGTPPPQKRTFIAGINGAALGRNVAAVLVDATTGQLGTMVSSRRFKYDIHDMGQASDNLLRLRPVTFRYKQAESDGSHPLEFGLIAEEVAEVYPELVQYAPTGEPNSVLYHVLPAMLLNEVQKQHQQLEAQATELASLRARLEALAPGPSSR